MTMDIKMLKAISDGAQAMAAQADQMAIFAAGMAEGAKQMAESMRAVVEDCAQQIMERRKTGISEKAALSEAFDGIKPDACPSQPQEVPSGATQGHTPEVGTPGTKGRDTASQALTANNSSDEPTLDLVTLRAFVAAKSSPENRAKIKAILRKYGAEKLTELKEEVYPSVKAEVGAL